MQTRHENFVFDEKNGLSYRGQPVSDFNLSVTDKKIFLGPSGAKGKPSYQIEASYTDGRPPCRAWTDKLRNLDLFELFEIDDTFLTAENRKLLLSKLMREAGQVPNRNIANACGGLQTVDNIPIYAFGEHILSYRTLPEKYEIVTQHVTKPVQYTDKKELLNLCEAYISLLPGVTDILFFGSLFAILKPFLDRLGIPCGFLLALVAPSGHLKTTLARIYALWLDPESGQETNFCSRQRDREIINAIDGLPGQNFLIDDLHKISNANESARQERRLDIVSREVNSKNCGAHVIITGESMKKMGIFSCIDRIFQVSMPVMDASQIERLKAGVSALPPNLMPSVALEFARALMKNYENVLKDIKDFYDKNVKDHSVSGYSTRSHRHALFIRMTECLFEKYMHYPELRFSENKKALDSAIERQLDLQRKELQKIRSAEEEPDYIAELYRIITSNPPCIKICGKQSEYEHLPNACLLSNDKIYITAAAMKEALFTYYKRHVSAKLVMDAFHKEGLLEEEPGSRGRQKNYLGKKHYVIPLRDWTFYMHSNGYSISEKEYNDYVKPYLRPVPSANAENEKIHYPNRA